MVLPKDVKTIQREYKIIGRQDLITQCLAADKADKHMLIEGPVGVGKTTIASAITNFLGRSFFRVDGDERYTSAKIVGWFDPPVVLKNGYTRDTFVPGPLVETMEAGGVLFINEINRMPEATQNTLLPVMDEGQLHVPKLGTINAKNGFRIIATQNPEASVGVTPLGEALRDRYVWLYLDYHTEAEEKEIVHINTGVEDTEIVELAVAITRATRDYTDIRRGASVRGAIDITSLYTQLPGKGYKVWEQAAIMSLVPKIELHDDTQKSSTEVIKTLVKAVLANF
ncbi:MAG: AAA family ATPase [Candidatus Hermodarchaeia archaeon]|jgi:MoxR-like ATPase